MLLFLAIILLIWFFANYTLSVRKTDDAYSVTAKEKKREGDSMSEKDAEDLEHLEDLDDFYK